MSKIIILVHLFLFASLFVTSYKLQDTGKAKVKGKVENHIGNAAEAKASSGKAKEGQPITQKAEKKEGGSDYIFGPIPGESSFT